jgi:hypothetical protein
MYFTPNNYVVVLTIIHSTGDMVGLIPTRPEESTHELLHYSSGIGIGKTIRLSANPMGYRCAFRSGTMGFTGDSSTVERDLKPGLRKGRAVL